VSEINVVAKLHGRVLRPSLHERLLDYAGPHTTEQPSLEIGTVHSS
jgi:hypothetical protein